MSEGKSISEYQSESASDLEDDFFSVTGQIEIFSERDDGEYFLAEESLEGTLDASFKSIPCTVVSYQDNLGLNDLDPRAVVMLCCSNVVQVPLSLNPFQLNLEFGTTHQVALCVVHPRYTKSN